MAGEDDSDLGRRAAVAGGRPGVGHVAPSTASGGRFSIGAAGGPAADLACGARSGVAEFTTVLARAASGARAAPARGGRASSPEG